MKRKLLLLLRLSDGVRLKLLLLLLKLSDGVRLKLLLLLLPERRCMFCALAQHTLTELKRV